ncbi:MAG: hypothetical protein ACYC2R_00050 [Burkholderiales bacterium]
MIARLLLICAVMVSLPVWAGRILPADGKLGDLRQNNYPMLQISGSVFHSAPGARFYDGSNRMVLPGMLPQAARVLYRLDMNGDLSQMWLLTPDEDAALSAAVN